MIQRINNCTHRYCSLTHRGKPYHWKAWEPLQMMLFRTQPLEGRKAWEYEKWHFGNKCSIIDWILILDICRDLLYSNDSQGSSARERSHLCTSMAGNGKAPCRIIITLHNNQQRNASCPLGIFLSASTISDTVTFAEIYSPYVWEGETNDTIWPSALHSKHVQHLDNEVQSTYKIVVRVVPPQCESKAFQSL